jgi:hypothetical protein
VLFSSESVDEVKEIKIRTAKYNRQTKSSFSYDGPKGAPIKNIIKQAYAITNLSKKQVGGC